MTEHKPWLSLPDEDPPERGLAELMAAARMKAEVMANPPWWKRLFVLMRRPPVLALATVVVVVCGVIVVGHDHDQAMSPAPALDVPAGSLDTRARGTAPEPPPPQQQEQQQPPPIEKKHEATLQRPPVQHVDKAPQRVQETKPLDDVMSGDAKADTQAARYETTVDEGEATKASETPKGGLKAPDPLARCRAAAARRDCATAKACVDGAPASYKATAKNDAALKSCL